MTLIRRILLLLTVSIAGVGLLAPLAARSAAPAPSIVDRLLPDTPAAALADRGSLSTRATPDRAPDAEVESLASSAPEPPGSVPMEATLYAVAPPAAISVAAPQRRAVTYDGNSVWDDLAQCESGGNWAINTGNGYYGGLQFSHPTWHAYGGGEFAEYPHQATREEQIAVAERLHAARGFAPWPACRVKLGLP